jgi:DNA-binding protein YbaB
MFNGIKNAASAVQNVSKLKAQQAKLQKLLSEITVQGNSKNGKVTVTITGEQKITNIEIEPELITFVQENFIALGKEDNILSKSIMEAVEDAISKVQGEVVKKMQESNSLGDLMGMLQAAGGGQ